MTINECRYCGRSPYGLDRYGGCEFCGGLPKLVDQPGLYEYEAQIAFIPDDGEQVDKYYVAWYRNKEPILEGVLDPTLNVIKYWGGQYHLKDIPLTELKSLGMFKYFEKLHRITKGIPYLAEVHAVIDGFNRKWYALVGVD